MEQVQSDLQALKRLYGLVHKGPTDDNVRKHPYLIDCPYFPHLKLTMLWIILVLCFFYENDGLRVWIHLKSSKDVFDMAPEQNSRELK
jgi:hypothetical protein